MHHAECLSVGQSTHPRRPRRHPQAASTVKGSLEEHAQRLRERADVTQSLRKWADQVLQEAARWAGLGVGRWMGLGPWGGVDG